MRLHDICLWYLWENRMFTNTEWKISIVIKASSWDTSKVTNTRKNNRNQFLKEVIHSVSTECDHHTDRHTFSELEVRDGFSRVCYLWKLSRDEHQIILQRREIFISRSDICSDSHIDNDFFNTRSEHRIRNLERFLNFWKDCLCVVCAKWHSRKLELSTWILSDSDFFCIFYSISYTSRFSWLWVDKHNIGSIDRFLHFQDLSRLSSLWLHVSCNDSDSFYDDLSFLWESF